MTDLELFLVVVSALCALYALFTFRASAHRLHYRDRPLFWRGVALPLGLAGLGLGLLAYALLTDTSTGVFWAAAALGALTAALAWLTELEPNRVVRWAYRTVKS
ncbi:hypothetical protein GO986_01285 [Deinococcus sp. HMF7620]|uniref:Uncharacterized protein n=1 Tax=Deinococcus arboris TaxID=2682977 RepID=A0A7C9LRE4_9DEIO|nr:hypothetical protein [Deinococcus arboris]MVN85400.1 hypothetical protein [Deinococcus arboris]